VGAVVPAIGAFLGWSRFVPYGMSTAEGEAVVHELRGSDAEFF